jgi:serine phosphatase RsbU (regulator of sigma subunit)
VALGYFTGHDRGNALRYIVAGQPQPLRVSAGGTVTELPLAMHRIPIGAMNNGEYEVLEVAMKPGDMIVAYSDGVIEAQNGAGEFFGSHRLHQVFRKPVSSPQEAVDRVLTELQSFTSGTDAYDDVTLMVIARRPEVHNA